MKHAKALMLAPRLTRATSRLGKPSCKSRMWNARRLLLRNRGQNRRHWPRNKRQNARVVSR